MADNEQCNCPHCGQVIDLPTLNMMQQSVMRLNEQANAAAADRLFEMNQSTRDANLARARMWSGCTK